jgi:flagellar protein FlbD
MIELTTLKGTLFYLNPELIEQVEEVHDTIITMTGGKKIRVSERAQEVAEKVMEYRKAIHRVNWEGME